MVKSKLPPRSGSSLETVETHPRKGVIKFFYSTSLKQGIDCRTKVFSKNYVPQSIFINEEVILINNSANLNKEKRIISTHY